MLLYRDYFKFIIHSINQSIWFLLVKKNIFYYLYQKIHMWLQNLANSAHTAEIQIFFLRINDHYSYDIEYQLTLSIYQYKFLLQL